MVARVFIRPGDEAEWKNGVASRGEKVNLGAHGVRRGSGILGNRTNTVGFIHLESGRVRLWWQFKPHGRGASEGARGP